LVFAVGHRSFLEPVAEGAETENHGLWASAHSRGGPRTASLLPTKDGDGGRSWQNSRELAMNKEDAGPDRGRCSTSQKGRDETTTRLRQSSVGGCVGGFCLSRDPPTS